MARQLVALEAAPNLRQRLLIAFLREISPDRPAWATDAGAAAEATNERTNVDHVVMCWVVARRLCEHRAEIAELLEVATLTCLITPDGHRAISYLKAKPHLADLEPKMLAARSPSELRDLGWERYRREGLSARPYAGPEP